jgi:hypothetical protein
VAQPLALDAQVCLGFLGEALRVLDERLELGEPRRRRICIARDRLVMLAGGNELAPGAA